jgi:hypothetical protein
METLPTTEPLKRLSKDLAKTAVDLSLQEVGYLVDAYYIMQESRIRSAAQIREMEEGEEPHNVLDWFHAQAEMLENQVKRALDKWTDAQPLGIWCKSICGIGPVISAGLLAHIDITKAPTAGHIWRFAGLDPTTKWEKKTKRPYNATLKTLCTFKLGESFVKVQNNDKDVYGKLYAQRKKLEQERNERLEFKDQAETILKTKNIDKKTDAYKAYVVGKLPPAHIHARARRYAVKIFLSHYHQVAYKMHYGVDAPAPYPIAILGHAHKIEPPDFDLEP